MYKIFIKNPILGFTIPKWYEITDSYDQAKEQYNKFIDMWPEIETYLIYEKEGYQKTLYYHKVKE